MNNDRNFYLTLVSNKSTEFHPNNNASKFSIQLPRLMNLEGGWVVGLCDLNIPIGFSHIYPQEGCIGVDGTQPGGITVFLPHGVYENTEAIINALNGDKILNQHFEYKFNS